MKILLACAAGMSTSLLARNVEELVKERGLDVSIEATSTCALDEGQWRGADVVLVAPQMRHELAALQARGAEYQVPVAAIPPRDYATADAQSLLEQATVLVENQAFHKEAGPQFHKQK